MVTDSRIIDADVQQLRTTFAGPLLCPFDERYEEVRSIWNGAIRRRPAVVASCTGGADVLAALRFARDRGLEISVRGGGHLWGLGTLTIPIPSVTSPRSARPGRRCSRSRPVAL